MNDKSKKIFLPESDIHIKLIPGRMCKYDTPVTMGWRGNEPVLSFATEPVCYIVDMCDAYKEMDLDISVLESDLLTGWVNNGNKTRWNFVLIHAYLNTLKNGNCYIDRDVICYAVGQPDRFFSTAIIANLSERIQSKDAKIFEAISKAKECLFRNFKHPKADEIVHGYLVQWMAFSLGLCQRFLDWNEVVSIITSIEVGNSTIYPVPGWINDILYSTSPEPQFELAKGDEFTTIEELLEGAGFEVCSEEEGLVAGIESMEESPFLTPDVEQEPIHHSNMMKGNGKRKLVNKNGYTYPKPKGRWS